MQGLMPALALLPCLCLLTGCPPGRGGMFACSNLCTPNTFNDGSTPHCRPCPPGTESARGAAACAPPPQTGGCSRGNWLLSCSCCCPRLGLTCNAPPSPLHHLRLPPAPLQLALMARRACQAAPSPVHQAASTMARWQPASPAQLALCLTMMQAAVWGQLQLCASQATRCFPAASRSVLPASGTMAALQHASPAHQARCRKRVLPIASTRRVQVRATNYVVQHCGEACSRKLALTPVPVLCFCVRSMPAWQGGFADLQQAVVRVSCSCAPVVH